MNASLSVIAAADAAPSCAADATILCARVREFTGSAWPAGDAGALVETPARILLSQLVAVIARLLLHRGIRRLTDRTATGTVPTLLRPLRSRVGAARRDGGEQLVARRTRQARVIGSVQVVIDMPVALDTDLERCRTVMPEVAETMHADEAWSDVLLAPPESLGAEDVTVQGVVMRVPVRTTSTAQRRAGRELRMRLSERFVAEGIRTPSLPVAAAAGQGSR